LGQGKVPSVFLLNLAFYHDESYEQVLKRLSETAISSALYFILSGPNDGAIITRDINSVDNIEHLTDWFLVQTNADREIWDSSRDGAEKKL
jgi:hypothetical protein